MAAHDPGLLFHPQLAIQVVCKDRCIQYMYVCLFAHSLSDRNGKSSISHSNQSKQRYETCLLKKKKQSVGLTSECYFYGSVSAGRENGANYVPNFFLKFTVTKRFDFFKIPQLFFICSIKIVSFWVPANFLIKQFSPILPPIGDFLAIVEAFLELKVWSWA